MEWFEILPPSCPPADAMDCKGIYYRIANGNPAQSEDFFSHRKLQPDKVFKGEGIDECIVCSLSVFSDKEEAQKKLKLPKFRKAVIVEISLEGKDGKMKKTFGPAHYSWWRTKAFDVSQAKVV